MADQTLTDVTRNYDDAAISGLLNGENITLNNSTLTINSDVRWGQQAAVFGNITISPTLGGTLGIDGSTVWWLPFDASTGNVPALGTVGVDDVTGSLGGQGEFLGVWTALGTAPLAAGTPMPLSGFIKLRQATLNFTDNEVVTLAGGATATINSATGGEIGWIHVVGEETSTANIPRLGSLGITGSWFQLGVTNGADDQTFQFPVTDACPAIQIETAVGSGVYEWYLNAGSRWGTATQFVSTDERGKYFGMDNATGIITIARRATNACGFKPVTGLRVRIPNVILSSSTSANWNANTLNATLASRYDLTTTSAGDIYIRGASCNWYLSMTSAFNVEIEQTGILEAMLISNTASMTDLDDVAIGLRDAASSSPLTVTNCFSGGTWNKVRAARYQASATGQFAISMADCDGFTFTDCMAELFGNTTVITRGNATIYSLFLTRCSNFTIDNLMAIGGRIELAQCSDIDILNTKYADMLISTTTTTNPLYAISLSSFTNNIYIEGFANFAGLTNVQPYSGIVNLQNTVDIEIRNIGTPAAPYNMGTVNASGLGINAAVAIGITARRVYLDNTRTNSVLFTNTCQEVLLENVWGDYADSQAIAAVNALIKGARWTNSVTGQTSVYGRHWEDAFTSTTTGRILLAFNEALAATADQVEIVSGLPVFTSTGQIIMKNTIDEVIFTMPYFCLGYTSFANIAPTITGTNTANFTFQYRIDLGSGFSGGWFGLSGASLSSQPITPTTGFRLQIRVTVNTANNANALTYLRIDGVTNATDQQIQYPLPTNRQGNVTNVVNGSRIQVYNVTTATEIANAINGTTYTLNYNNGSGITDGDVIRIRITYQSGLNARLPFEITTVANSSGFEVLANQVVDTIYATNAIDGSLVTELTADFPNIQIDSNDVDGETTVQRIYAWMAYIQTTATGIEDFFGVMTAEDLVNYRVNSSVADLQLDNTIATPLLITGGRLYQSDGDTVIAPTSNSIQLDPSRVYVVETGTSGLTPTEASTLEKLNTLTEDVGGLRFTAQALEQAPAGGGGSSDWTATERNQIRHRLGIDGTAAAPSASPSLATPSSVRTELTTELGRIDATISSRLSTAGYTAPPSVTAIRDEMDTNSTKLDVAVGTRLATVGYTAPPSAATNASAVRTELSTELGRIDVATSTRLATAGYTAPDNATIGAIQTEVNSHPTLAEIEASAVLAKEATSAAIKTKTDNLPVDPASNTQVNTRLDASSYVAPANSDIAAIKTKTDNLPTNTSSELSAIKTNTNLIPASL